MATTVPIERLVDLLDPDANVLLNVSPDEAAEAVASGDPARVRSHRWPVRDRAEARTRRAAGAVDRPTDALFSRETRRWTVSRRRRTN